MKKIKTDVFILGGGSGGMGCLYRLAKNGVKVILCDKNSGFGGTSVYSGVSCWEPGVSLDGLHLPLAEELMKSGAYIGKSVSNGRLLNPEISDDTVINDFSKYPWGLSAKDKFGKYEYTLKRCNMFFSDRLNQMRRFQFDGDYINPAMKKILKNYENNFTAFFNTSLVSVKTEGDRVVSCTLDNGVEIEAKYFVDCGGNNIPLIRMCNCGTASDNDLNGVTYVFRVKKQTEIILTI